MMRIEWVRAVAFGGLTEMTLELGDGLTVVAGPNGSGKSTWHAAMYAGLCGQPPAAEQSKADQTFEELHAPWERDDWLVDLKLALDDGSTVTINQNLRGGPSTAVRHVPEDSSDHDVSAGVKLGSTIDVSGWLGLDRRSYAATSWVEQAQMRVADAADGRNELERALAACIGEDRAAQACVNIDEAGRRIGIDAGTGAGGDRLIRAEAEVERRRLLAAYLQHQRQSHAHAAEALQDYRTQAVTQRRRLRAAEAAAAAGEERRLRDKATSLQDRLATLIGSIASANPGYADPGYPRPSFGTVASDTEIHPSVAAAEQALYAAQNSLAVAEAPAWTPSRASTVVQLGADTQPQPMPSPWRGVGLTDRSLKAMCLGGIVLALLGVILGAVVNPFVGYGLAMVGVAFAVVALASLRRDRAAASPGPPAPTPTPPPPTPPPPTPPTSTQPTSTPIIGPGLPMQQRRWHLDQAQRRLADSLTARGYPATPDNAVMVLDSYRTSCADRAEEPQRLRAELDECQQQLATAERRAQEAREGVDQLLMITLWNVDIDAERLACEKAESAVTSAELDLANRGREIADLLAHGDPEHALDTAQQHAERLRLLNTTLHQAQTYLRQAQRNRRREVITGIQQHVRDYLPEITNDRRLKVDIDGHLHALLGESGHDVRKPLRGPHSTVDQSSLLTRIALGMHITDGRERGPLLLDDITSGADEHRVKRLLDVLLRIAQRRQVVVFAHDSATREWARARIPANPWLHLRTLCGVDHPPGTAAPAAE